MDNKQKRIFIILLLISMFYFSVFILPNNTGAKDQMMISLFEPDEFAQYPIVLKMITHEETVKQNLINFFIYGHYYYGWPFYASSALTVLIATLIQGYENTQLNILLLRQVISVLPMTMALFLLVYIQTKFKSYIRAIGLFILLLSVSAVVENNMWWHVDSLATLFIVAVLFFLDKDQLQFGQDFYLAAFFTGLATGTKVIGLFFFLVIPTYLLIGILQKQITWRIAVFRAVAFVGIMVIIIFISNPFLIYRSQMQKMIEILSRQASFQTQGWVLAYAKGPASWFPIIQSLYGKPVFIVLAFITLALGVWRKESRMRCLFIALWSIPFGVYVLYAIAIKPTHFFLPILLPVFSSLVIIFEFPPFTSKRISIAWIWGLLTIGIIGYQITVYINKDISMYHEVLAREEHEASLIFYQVLESEILPRIQTNEKLVVFRDVRMYLPRNSRWVIRSYWNSKYSTIETIKPDMILLWSQRISDYTQEGVRENALDSETFQDTYEFYVDADNNQLRGYKLVYRDSEGLFFVSDEIYNEYFK